MRFLLVSACLLSVFTLGMIGSPGMHQAAAAECTGDNCPPSTGQGGRDCERDRLEQTTS